VFERQKSGSVLCANCGRLVGVNDEQCFNCGRRNPSMWGFGGAIRALGADFGFVKLVIAGSIAVFIATLAIDPNGIRYGGFLGFMSPSQNALFLFGASGQIPVFELGRWWTVLSAGWLHGGILHIGFNMMITRNFAPMVAEYYGAGRMIIIYVVSSAVGFTFSSVMYEILPYIHPFGSFLGLVGLAGAPLTVGASAAVSGLLGALLFYANRTGSQVLRKQMMSYVIFFGIFGIFMGGIDNQAHLGGFVGGYYLARYMDPLEPEKGDHLVLALVCIAATALSIAASFAFGLQFFPKR